MSNEPDKTVKVELVPDQVSDNDRVLIENMRLRLELSRMQAAGRRLQRTARKASAQQYLVHASALEELGLAIGTPVTNDKEL